MSLPADLSPFPRSSPEARRRRLLGRRRLPDGAGRAVLCVQRMHATLGRDHLKSSDLPPKSQLITVRWNGWTSMRFAPTRVGRRADHGLHGAGAAAQRSDSGGGGRSERARNRVPRDAQLRAPLLKGETNWLSSTERAGRWARSSAGSSGLRLVCSSSDGRHRRKRGAVERLTLAPIITALLVAVVPRRPRPGAGGIEGRVIDPAGRRSQRPT